MQLSSRRRRPVQFEKLVQKYELAGPEFLFQSRSASSPRLSTQLESTVRYLGVEVDDALAISEQVDL